MAGNVDASATNLYEMYGFQRLNLQEQESAVQFDVDLEELRNILIAGLEEIPQE